MDHSEKTNKTKTTGTEETRFVFLFYVKYSFFCGTSNLLSVLLLVGFLVFKKSASFPKLSEVPHLKYFNLKNS